MGPITLNDLVGLDTALYAGRVVNTAFADRARNTKILAELVKAGRLGQKSGAGFYSYAKDAQGRRRSRPWRRSWRSADRPQRDHRRQEEITDRLFLPMLVEASLVLTEGIVREPADVDMGLILGIGFPALPRRHPALGRHARVSTRCSTRWASTSRSANAFSRRSRCGDTGGGERGIFRLILIADRGLRIANSNPSTG